MPYPPPPRTPSGPRRRSLLASAAGAALLLAGCSAGPGSKEGAPSASARARARAARDSADLLARYDAVLAAHPALAPRLGPLRAEVAAHAEAFGGTASAESPSPTVSRAAHATSSAASGSTASPSAASPSAASGSTASPAITSSAGKATTEKEALASLATAERNLADRRAHDLLEVPGELARLMASVAATGAAHAYLLTGGTT
ncbi:hypothetical protein OIB37_26680 [Streptomyces sp. NBC_00820]|uniref:hypothetical protein n=1 Tax=Streptomyces sp. NBC_00820 TaxID=2975842 RepID=UPI002ED40F8D|nr:hypothetical protein OIB37_26680 [Streptomyces sp. NBC_00820]